jgi:pimeloyl-ACP methyl ester carboxylesterase
MKARLFLISVWFLVLIGLGCNRLGVHKDWAKEGVVLGMEDRPRSNQLSRETLEILFRENLLELYSHDEEAAFEGLVAAILVDPAKQEDPRMVFAAAEFANVLAERNAPPWNRRPTLRPRGSRPMFEMDPSEQLNKFMTRNKSYLTYYGMATYLSSSYLALSSQRLVEEAFNPQFRQACEIYNYSLEQTLRFTLDSIPFHPDFFYRLDDPNNPTKVQFKLVGFDWTEEDIHELLPAVDFRSDDIGPSSHRKGIGVPLIGLRYRRENSPNLFYPPICAFPITALSVLPEEYDLEATERRDIIHLVNPWSEETLKVGNLEVPIEADLSTSLNYMLKETGFNSDVWKGFVGKDASLAGSVFLIQPHRAGRIPIVLCHGLLSSPEPWESLINGLLIDPWIRQNYEFWFMHYPTGRGLILNAADLRTALANVRHTLDPNRQDPALDRMVLVGHSMGGSLSTLLTHDSGNHIWDMAWSAPIDQLTLTPEERAILESVFYFKRQPYIERVVYLATPHRGAPLASRAVGWLGTQLVDLPSAFRMTISNLNDKNHAYSKLPLSEDTYTSVRQLREDSPVLAAMNQLDHPREVHFHNILGNREEGSDRGGDGVVPAANATIDWAETRLVVPARHTEIQRHPLVIREIHKILIEHANLEGVDRLEVEPGAEKPLYSPPAAELEIVPVPEPAPIEPESLSTIREMEEIELESSIQ